MFSQSVLLLNQSFTKRALLSGALVVCSFLCFLHAEMEDACEVYYKGDPVELKDSNVVVPDDVVALSSQIHVDMPIDTSTKVAPAAIFFVIDNSSSMSWESGMNDQDGLRFSVTRDLIDTINARFDTAQVGVAVFQRHLFYREGVDPRFAKCPVQDSGMYIPLLTLNESYAPDGKMGYEVLKEWLDTAQYTKGTVDYVDLKYQPSPQWPDFNSPATCINAGFDAARDAFKNTTYKTHRQFIIFLSDGSANWPSGNSAKDFVKGENVPTTFTVYFTEQGQAHPDIVEMTTNIQGNGYSFMNPNSAYWAVEVDILMQLLVDNVINLISQSVTAHPDTLIINGIVITDYDTLNQQFTFDQIFPLTDWTTHFDYEINYKMMIDSFIWVGDSIVDTIQILGDSATSGEFDVTIDPTITNLPNHYPHEFEMLCWQRELAFYYNGSPVNVVDETMHNLEIRFNYCPGDNDYRYTTVKTEISNVEGSKTDKETYTLSNSQVDTLFTFTFPREVLINVDPNQQNGTLQHQAPNDSIIAVFRNEENPTLPLDTLRIAVPFRLSGYIILQAGYYYDRNADGYVDSVFIKDSTDLEDPITDEQLKEIMDNNLIKLPASRGFTIDAYAVRSDGFALEVTENTGHEPATYIRDDDSIQVDMKILNVGGWVVPGTIPIFDKVAPIIMRKQVSYKGKGEWTPLLVDFQVDSVSDTLTVIFSETIKEFTDPIIMPFRFLNNDSNAQYTADLVLASLSNSLSNSVAKFTIDRVNSNVIDYFTKGDSVWIHEDNKVADVCVNESGGQAYNYQVNKKNIKRELNVILEMIPFDLDLISISPLDLSDINNEGIIIPIEIINLFDENALKNLKLQTNGNGDLIGMVIQIVPDFTKIDSLSLEHLFLEGDISIFDAVGNHIIRDKPMVFNSANKSLNYVWNGRNELDRYVGASSYLAVSKIVKWPLGKGEGKSHEKLTKKLLVAVKD
jgi:hypothetical protein